MNVINAAGFEPDDCSTLVAAEPACLPALKLNKMLFGQK
jgi:hypothetical protein